MKRTISIVTLVFLMASLGLVANTQASDPNALADPGRARPNNAVQNSAAINAVRTCTKCHDESETKPVLSILKSRHAVMADSRTPFADQACMLPGNLIAG